MKSRLILQISLPVLLLGGGALTKWYLEHNKVMPTVITPKHEGPLVRVLRVEMSVEHLDVIARGSVEPLRTVELAAEVTGRIVGAHASMRAGGTFTPNDVLVQIDPTDYRLQITQQQAAVARAELNLIREEAEAEAAMRAWQQLEGQQPADALVRREPQLEDARQALAAAKAMLERAHVDVERTKLMLPFSGRVRSVAADVGQTVQRGQRLATVLDTSAVEVRLPIPLQDAAFANLPLAGSVDDGPAVELTAEFAGRMCNWPARIVRTEGEVDRRTRQLTVVARATDAAGDAERPPLLVGMFVEARISGRSFDHVVVVPRGALDEGDRVWVLAPRFAGVDGWMPRFTSTLRRRAVKVLRAEHDRVILSEGLRPGELVCLSNLDAPVDGMRVRIAELLEQLPTEGR